MLVCFNPRARREARATLRLPAARIRQNVSIHARAVKRARPVEIWRIGEMSTVSIHARAVKRARRTVRKVTTLQQLFQSTRAP